MAHSFGKVLLSAQLACGFATAIDGRVDKIVDNLGVVKPTFMGAAPRIFEKAHGRIVTMQAAEGGLKEKLFNQAFKVGLEVDKLQARGQARPAGAQAPARPVRQAGLQQGPGPLRRPGPVLHLRRRGAQQGHRRVVQRRRHPDPRGLRHDRVLRRRYGQPPRGLQVRHRRPGPARQRGQARRGRRGPDPGPARHGRLPQPARGDREDAGRRGLAAHRRQGQPRRRRLPHHHRPDQGALQDLRRQVHRPVRRSSRSSRRSAPTPASSWSSARTGTTASR